LKKYRTPRTIEYNIKTDRVPFRKFCFISDLHDYPNEPLLEAIKDMDVCAILVPGDFIHSTHLYKRGIEFLAMASKIAPTYVTLGNHEMKFEGNIVDLVKNTGAILLDDTSVVIEGVNLGGLTTGYKKGIQQKRLGKTPAPNLEWLKSYSEEKGFKILLSHHPEYYDRYIKQLPIDLVLSGHAHGGQIRVLGQGIIAPGQGFFPKYTHGIYDNRLIVSSGVGNQFIVPRFNNPGEIIILNIGDEKND
jgi:predicted MPP superfamily phosphohydrolase